MNYKYVIPAFALTAGVLVLLTSVNTVNAETFSDKHQSLIQRLSQRFGIKESDLQSVFDEEREVRQKEMQTRFEEKLSEAVKTGTITDAQKTLILAKHKEIQSKRDSEWSVFQSMTPEQKRAAMQKQRNELEAWAKANGIDTSNIFPLMHGKGMGFGRGWK